MEMPRHRIAIVGGGPSGVSVFCELVHFLRTKISNKNIHITLIDKSGEFGFGMPYSTRLDGHVINMAVSTMSLKYDQVDHFYYWLLGNTERPALSNEIGTLRPDDVVPRRLFGDYVNYMYKDACEKAEVSGIKVEALVAEVTAIEEERSSVRLVIGQKERFYEHVFVCAGNTSPSVGIELRDTPGYFHDAWPEDRIMRAIPNDEPVIILGSGLTAIDVMITLQENNHRARIRMVSRHGLLPKVRNKAKPYELAYLSPRNIQKETQNGKQPLSLNASIALLRKEIENANAYFGSDEGYYQAKDSTHIEILRQDISRVKNGHANYFSVLKAIDKHAGTIWNAMSLKARNEFDQYLSTLWNVHCYPMPLLNGERTLRALESGQLSVHRRAGNLSYDAARSIFQVQTRLGTAEETIETRYVINATGQAMDLAATGSLLLQSGIRNGTFVQHPLGGIDVEFATGRAKAASGGFSNRVYAVGLLTRGVHFYTNSIVENVRCARRAAADAVDRIGTMHPLTVPIAMTLNELGRAAATVHQAEH